MNIIIEALRAHTLRGIYSLEKVPELTFRGWIERRSFKVSSPIEPKKFTLDVYSHDEILAAFAYDINRMASSSFESMHGATPEIDLPKSVGWLVIRSYYSAYFSVHAILRLFGIACSQLDTNESRSIGEVAHLYLCRNGVTVSSGYYKCLYDPTQETLSLSHLSNTHKDVWNIFYSFLDEISEKITASDLLQPDKNKVVEYLFTLRKGLSFRNTLTSGNWLSAVRNDVNYSHAMGAWFPYRGSAHAHEEMFRLVKKWQQAPTLDVIGGNLEKCDQLLFVATCVSVTSLCYGLLQDIFDINQKSFLKYSPLRLISQLAA